MFANQKVLALSVSVVLAPCMAAAQDWDGLYGGVTLGYTSHSATHTFDNGAPSGKSNPKGGLYGGFFGYAVQNGNTVYGGELDFEGSNASGDYINATGSTSGGRAELNWQGSIRAVVGMAGAIGGNPALYYMTAGYARGDFDFYGGPSASYLTNTYSEQMNGWTAGFGVDTRLGGNMTLRTEYRYTDYGTASGMLNPGFPGVTMPVDVRQHAIRVGVRMDF